MGIIYRLVYRIKHKVHKEGGENHKDLKIIKFHYYKWNFKSVEDFLQYVSCKIYKEGSIKPLGIIKLFELYM